MLYNSNVPCSLFSPHLFQCSSFIISTTDFFLELGRTFFFTVSCSASRCICVSSHYISASDICCSGLQPAVARLLQATHHGLACTPLAARLRPGPGAGPGPALLVCGARGAGKTRLTQAVVTRLARPPTLAHITQVDCRRLRGNPPCSSPHTASHYATAGPQNIFVQV